jgi:aldehyde dehydrogenase (NAD+)
MSTIHTALRDLSIQAVNSGGSTGNAWWSGRNDGSLLPSINPATGEQIAGVYPCSSDDYQRIVKESIEAFRTWRMVPAPKRGEMVRLIGQA